MDRYSVAGASPQAIGSLVPDGDGDFDVAAGGIGVRTNLVGSIRKGLRLIVGEFGDNDLEVDREDEAAIVGRKDVHLAADGGVRDRDLLLVSNRLQGRVEASGISGGEQFFRVRTVPGSAHLFRDRQVEVDRSGRRRHVTVAAGACRQGFCGVKRIH